jgi:hypothetical protein
MNEDDMNMAKNVLAWIMGKPTPEEVDDAISEYRQMIAACAEFGIRAKRLPQIVTWLANGVMANYADWVEIKLQESIVEKGEKGEGESDPEIIGV